MTCMRTKSFTHLTISFILASQEVSDCVLYVLIHTLFLYFVGYRQVLAIIVIIYIIYKSLQVIN